MCGRYVLQDPDYINSRYNLENPLKELLASFNVAPGALMPTISRNSPNRGVIRRWGLIPSWARDPRIGFKLTNARSETITQKPSFRTAFATRRCLIPNSGFYEWHRTPEGKTPYYIKIKSESMASFAGLYDTWTDATGKLTLETFTIITTAANSLIAPIHDRMPVFISKEDEDTWLSKTTPTKDLLALLQPYPENDMEAYPVSKEVNSTRNNSPDLLTPID